MVRKYFFIFVLLLGIDSFYCKSPTYNPATSMNLNWNFYDTCDSLLVKFELEYEINIIPKESDKPDTGTVKQGVLLEHFFISKETSWIYNNMSLSAKLFYNDLTIWDSTMAYSDLNFIEGTDQWGNKSKFVSYLDFYITVPDTTTN